MRWEIGGKADGKDPFPIICIKDVFSSGLANREDSLWPDGPMPGQESMRLAKKGGGSSFPEAGFRRFNPGIPLPPRLFAETQRGEPGRVLPALFDFGACFLARAT